MEKYYEKIVVSLTSIHLQSRKSLHNFLKRRGYTSMDDFYFLARKEAVPSWQSDIIVHIDVRRMGLEVYETQEDVGEEISTDWDELELTYLMATIPQENISRFVEEVNEISEEFGLMININSGVIDNKNLERLLNNMAEEIRDMGTLPGSKELRILISLEYPK